MGTGKKESPTMRRRQSEKSKESGTIPNDFSAEQVDAVSISGICIDLKSRRNVPPKLCVA